MPTKPPKKTIQSNPLDSIETIQVNSKSGLRPSKKTTNQGRKKMSSTNNSQDNAQPNINSAEEIFTIESNTQRHSPADDFDHEGINYQHQLAKSKIMNASQWATLAGFIPVIGLDTLTISGVQLKMVYDLCDTYRVPFKKEAVLAIIGAAFGGSFTTVIAAKVTDTAINKIPYIGTAISFISQPAISFATTYAIGMVFLNHFEKNGSLSDFDLKSTQTIFDDQLVKAKVIYKQQAGFINSAYTSGVSKVKSLLVRNFPASSSKEDPAPSM